MFGWGSGSLDGARHTPVLDARTAVGLKAAEGTFGADCWREGMSTVLPTELFGLFTGKELRELICGSSEIDFEMLKVVTEYEGCEETDDHCIWFFEVLREMSTKEKESFLSFVWARKSLPSTVAGFEQNFKLQKDSKTCDEKDQAVVDEYLPHASTCFFSLALPKYSSKEVLRRKLLTAIKNSPNIDMDFTTNASELRSGWM